jgi:hypothetical protein
MGKSKFSLSALFYLIVIFAFVSAGCSAAGRDSYISYVDDFESANILRSSISLSKPKGWKEINTGAQQMYMHPDMENKDDRVLFTVYNYGLIEDKETVLQAKAYEKGSSTETWVNTIIESLEKLPEMPKYEIIKSKEISKKAVMVKIADSNAKRLQYAIFQVEDDVPIAVEVDAYGKFSDENYIKELGVLNDLIHMSKSVKVMKKQE